MKAYIVRINGRIVGRVMAENLREAEMLARRRFGAGASVAIS